MVIPSMTILPESKSSIPLRIFMRVLLPPPLFPTTPKISPGLVEKLMPFRADISLSLSLYDFERFSICSNAISSYLTLAPVSTGVSGLSRTAAPATSAARSMACDSMPKSLAGLRLARTTTCVPTSFSGW